MQKLKPCWSSNMKIWISVCISFHHVQISYKHVSNGKFGCPLTKMLPKVFLETVFLKMYWFNQTPGVSMPLPSIKWWKLHLYHIRKNKTIEQINVLDSVMHFYGRSFLQVWNNYTWHYNELYRKRLNGQQKRLIQQKQHGHVGFAWVLRLI